MKLDTQNIKRTPKVEDVAEYILSKTGEITAMKLQKLVYYSQAWSLAFDDEPLFIEGIEAWANGPVVRKLFAKHARKFLVKSVSGQVEALSDSVKQRIDSVLSVYANLSAQFLSDLTHSEKPWKMARKDVPEGRNSKNIITLDSMKKFYRALYIKAHEQKAR